MNQNVNLEVFQINKLWGWVHYRMDDVETEKNQIKWNSKYLLAPTGDEGVISLSDEYFWLFEAEKIVEQDSWTNFIFYFSNNILNNKPWRKF